MWLIKVNSVNSCHWLALAFVCGFWFRFSPSAPAFKCDYAKPYCWALAVFRRSARYSLRSINGTESYISAGHQREMPTKCHLRRCLFAFHSTHCLIKCLKTFVNVSMVGITRSWLICRQKCPGYGTISHQTHFKGRTNGMKRINDKHSSRTMLMQRRIFIWSTHGHWVGRRSEHVNNMALNPPKKKRSDKMTHRYRSMAGKRTGEQMFVPTHLSKHSDDISREVMSLATYRCHRIDSISVFTIEFGSSSCRASSSPPVSLLALVSVAHFVFTVQIYLLCVV